MLVLTHQTSFDSAGGSALDDGGGQKTSAHDSLPCAMRRTPLRRFCLLGILFVAAIATAQPAAGPQLTKPPTLVKQVEAIYPPDAADAGTTSTVGMEVDIGPDGLVIDARIVQSGGAAFDQSALAALRQFEFTPAEVDGQPSAVRIRYDYQFVMTAAPVTALDTRDAGPVVNFAGTLLIAGTREPLAGAQVIASEHEAVTDERGHFAIDGLPLGETQVLVVSPGYQRFTVTEDIKPGERTEVTYYVARDDGAQTTVVHGERERREVAQVKLSQSEVKYIAGTRGDAFKVVQSLPGVARSPFGGGVLVIRGSKSWDSRVYIDEIQIPQLFHFAGLTSTFNSALLDDISFQPGNFGVEYGRSIGGLVNADARTPSKTNIHGYVDLNLFDVSGMVEAPISTNWSVSLSARRGFTDLLLPFALDKLAPQLRSSVGFSVAPRSWDYQFRLERRVKDSADRFFVALYGSSDSFAFVQPSPFVDLEAEGVQGSFGNSVTYNRLVVGIDQRLSKRVTFISRNSVGLDLYDQLGGTTDSYFHGRQYPIQLRERFKIDVPEAMLTFSAGLDALVVPAQVDAQTPPPFKANQIPDPFVERRLVAEKSTTVYGEPGVFVEAVWSPVQSLRVIAGVRADYETYMRKLWVDPRLSVLWSPLTWLTLKAGAAIYHQPPDYRTGQLSPVFGNPDLLPEGARHYTVGAETRLTDTLGLDVQLYYKDLFDQARATLASGIGSDVNIPGAETRYTSKGYGRAYGAEFLLRTKEWKHFVGWVAYTWSRFERDYYGDVIFAPGPLDQPHNIIAAASYKFPFDIIFGARFRYASGPLVTPIVASLYDTQGNYYYPLPGLPWSQRLPDFWQLDLRIDKRFVFKSWVLSIYLDVQNATNHQNVEGIFYNYDYTQKQYVYGIPVLPALGVRGEF